MSEPEGSAVEKKLAEVNSALERMIAPESVPENQARPIEPLTPRLEATKGKTGTVVLVVGD